MEAFGWLLPVLEALIDPSRHLPRFVPPGWNVPGCSEKGPPCPCQGGIPRPIAPSGCPRERRRYPHRDRDMARTWLRDQFDASAHPGCKRHNKISNVPASSVFHPHPTPFFPRPGLFGTTYMNQAQPEPRWVLGLSGVAQQRDTHRGCCQNRQGSNRAILQTNS